VGPVLKLLDRAELRVWLHGRMCGSLGLVVEMLEPGTSVSLAL